MDGRRDIAKEFMTFVDGLSEKECRRELFNAYLQMERCLSILRGEKAKPVVMKDNGESSDLELFYTCKKVRQELDYLNKKKDGEGD